MILRALLLILLLLPGAASAAVAIVDTPSCVFSDSTGGTLTGVTTSGSDKGLFVAVKFRDDDNLGVTINDVTYATVSIEPEDLSIETCTGGDRVRIHQYLVVNPAASGSVVVTLSGKAQHSIHAIAVSGVDQTTPIGDSNSATGVNPSFVLTSATDDLCLDSAHQRTSTCVTVGAGQTQETSCAGSKHCGRTSSEAGAASVTMSWTASASCTVQAGMSLAQSGAAPAAVPQQRIIIINDLMNWLDWFDG